MKGTLTLLVLVLLFVGNVGSAVPSLVMAKNEPVSVIEQKETTKHTLYVRITFWFPGDDKYGYQTSTGVRLKPWKHAAVNPHVIPYFSKIEIPALDKTVVAVDTGTDVINRKAAKLGGKTFEQKKAAVIDIPVSSEKEYAYWESQPAIFTQVTWYE